MQRTNDGLVNKCVRARTLCVSDLVPKATGHVQKDLSACKFASK